MKKEFPLIIERKTLLIFAVAGFVLTILAGIFKISHWSLGVLSNDFLIGAGLTFMVSTWIIVLVDILKNNIEYKTFWLAGMFLMGAVIPMLYLYKKEDNTTER